jgi:hypothetical protein
MAQSNSRSTSTSSSRMGLGATAGLPSIRTEKSSPTGASSAARKKNIPKAPTTSTTRSGGFSWAVTHSKHNVSGMPGSTPTSPSVCAERLRRRARLCNRPLIGSRYQRPLRSISRTVRSADWILRQSASTALRLSRSFSTAVSST